MNRLQNKIAVVTGGTSGIGLATALAYQREGATVVVTARTEVSRDQAQERYRGVLDVVKADVTRVEDLRKLAEHVSAAYGRVDILFANAGVAFFAPISDLDEAFYYKQFDTNVKGVLFTVQALNGLLAAGASVILNTSGVNTKGLPGASVYSATKAAVRSLARTLSAELIGRGIRVNALSPGPVETPIFGKTGMSEAEFEGFAQQMRATTPIGRFGKPEELAAAAVFLASDEAQFAVGAEFVVDGGFSQL